jgi:glutathionyl-hydroquinone reductase
MRNLIKQILKEEIVSIGDARIGHLKRFVEKLFSKYDWFDFVTFDIDSHTNIYGNEIPEIIIEAHVIEDKLPDDFYDNYLPEDDINKIDIIMDILFPNDIDGVYTSVWTWKVVY